MFFIAGLSYGHFLYECAVPGVVPDLSCIAVDA